MENDPLDFDLTLQIDKSDQRSFCQLSLRIKENTIGNPEEWTVTGLMSGSISAMLLQLEAQSSIPDSVLATLANKERSELFQCFFDWQWGSGRCFPQQDVDFSNVDARIFCALPLGTENFDGEFLFAVRASADLARLVWRDFDSREIRDYKLNFHAYLDRWRQARNQLERLE